MFLKKYIQFGATFFSFFIFTSIIFSISSVFWTTDITYSLQDKKEIMLGFPFRFAVSDQSRWDGNNFNISPEKVEFMWQAPGVILWYLFVANIFVAYIFFTTILFLIQIYYPTIIRWLKLFSLKNIIVGCFMFLLLVIILFWTQSMRAKYAQPISPELMQPVEIMQPVETIQPALFQY